MRPHCAFCCQHKGWIVYGWEHSGHSPHLSGQPAECPGCYEVMAPCPFCEDGQTIELAAYGDRGYWQGEKPTPAQVDETCRCREQTLRGQVGRQRLNEMMFRLNEQLGDSKLDRRREIQEQTRASVAELLTEPKAPAVKLDLMDTTVSTNGHVDDDEIGTL